MAKKFAFLLTNHVAEFLCSIRFARTNSPCGKPAYFTCVSSSLNRCHLFSGFAGKQCETNIDDCASADCGHGKCVDGIDDHNCNCTGSGYNGSECKEDINECLLADTCFNNGTCKNYAGGFLCTCLEDYRGKNCEEKIDDCAPKPCKNGKNFPRVRIQSFFEIFNACW